MSWNANVKTGVAWPVVAGIATLATGFAAFGGWAAVAPLHGAVIASGKVVTSGRNKTVQHLEGGIVSKILVQDGDVVEIGQPLVVLDATAAQATLNRLKAQLLAVEASEARSLAERDGSRAIQWQESMLSERARPEVAKIIEDHEASFKARLEKHREELAVLDQQIAALKEQIAGDETQKAETVHQIALVAEERGPFETLLRKGLTTRSRVSELKRLESDLRGKQGQLAAAMAQARQSIGEIQEKIGAAKIARVADASSQLDEARSRRADLLEQIKTAGDVLKRTVVLSPASGTVINLTKYNLGAVVNPGQEMLQIVPNGNGLVIEARIRPQDVDEVRVGQPARLSFAALDPRSTPQVPADVVQLSADRFEDQRTGEGYYLARLRISPDPLTGFDAARVGPGQPVEVFITTGERTFLSYLVEPIEQTLRRGLRES